MAIVVYKPKYTIDTINSNFANKRVTTNNSTFIADNFSIDNSKLSNDINPNTVTAPAPLDLSLVSQIMVDYGDGPISIGMKECLEIINQNVQTGEFSNGNIFGDFVISGGNTDFRYITDSMGSEIVIANLQMTSLLLFVSSTYQNNFNAVVLNIVRDLRKGVYDYNNYIATIQAQSRKIAKIILGIYG